MKVTPHPLWLLRLVVALPASHENLLLNFGFLQGRPHHFAYIAFLPLFREFSRKESRLVCVALHSSAIPHRELVEEQEWGPAKKNRDVRRKHPVELGTNTLSRFDELL